MKQIQRIHAPSPVVRELYQQAFSSSENGLEYAPGVNRRTVDSLIAMIRQGAEPHTASPYLLSTETASRIIEALLANQKIRAIKEARDETDLGLAFSKQMVEMIQDGIRTETVFSPSSILLDDKIVQMFTPGTSASADVEDDPVTKLFRNLQQARAMAGQESYRRLSRVAEALGRYISPTSIHRAMNGPSVPPWETMVTLLLVFRVPPEDVQTRWHSLWAAARAHQMGHTFPDTASDEPTIRNPGHIPPRMPPGEECSSCGAWIVNLERHHAWHWRIENQHTTTHLRHIG